MATTTPDIAKTEIAIVEMTNQFRAKNGLAAVTVNPQLVNAARAFAAHLARTETFSHTADGRQPAERVRTAGYQYCQVAENLALNLDSRGFETRDLARQMVEGWINSPGHRKNLLAAHATETGVAVARVPDKDPKFVSVQLFGRPLSLALKFQIANTTRTPVSYALGETTHEVSPGTAITHTACTPSPLTFQSAGSGATAKPLNARYETRDGQVFTLKAGAKGEVAIDVGQRERLP